MKKIGIGVLTAFMLVTTLFMGCVQNENNNNNPVVEENNDELKLAIWNKFNGKTFKVVTTNNKDVSDKEYYYTFKEWEIIEYVYTETNYTDFSEDDFYFANELEEGFCDEEDAFNDYPLNYLWKEDVANNNKDVLYINCKVNHVTNTNKKQWFRLDPTNESYTIRETHTGTMVFEPLDNENNEDDNSSSGTSVELDGEYTISEANEGSVITFSNGEWTFTYSGQSKTGSYSQSGSKVTISYEISSLSLEAVFTTFEKDETIILTKSSGQWQEIIGSVFMITDGSAYSDGIITLTKN